MKKILMLIIFIAAVTSPKMANAISRNSALTIKPSERQILQSNTAYIDFYINSLGNKIKEIETQISISGPFNPNWVSYRPHPDFPDSLHRSTGFKLKNYNAVKKSDGVLLTLIFEATEPNYFNEGSQQTPIFRIGIPPLNGGLIKSTFNRARTHMVFADDPEEKNTSNIDYYEYSVEVLSTSTPQPTVEPTPAPTPSPIPTSTPDFRPIEEKLDQLGDQIEQVQAEVSAQSEQLSIIQKLIRSITNFIENIFRK